MAALTALLLTTNIGPTRHAIRLKISRAHAAWDKQGDAPDKALGEALKDGRIAANKARRLVIPEDDLFLIIGYCVMDCGGRVSQGWRNAFRENWLTEALSARFLANSVNKSHVPATIREAVRYKVAMTLEQHHGPKGARDNGAWIDRYWGCVPSQRWWCGDDVTLPVYYWVPDGKGWFTLLRGQFLLLIDARSTCILSFALMPEPTYNARVIRTLITTAADEYGLPTKGFYFEKGIWKDAKILTGEKTLPFEGPEVERGLCEFGLVFQHAIRARSKPVERVAGALQNLMEGEPGYAGRDERHDGFEDFQRAKLAVESRKLDPRKKFHSAEEWKARLDSLCERYNADPREGKMTGGFSPEQAYELFKDKQDPPAKLYETTRYLLAHHKRPIRVTVNGITLHFGKQAYNYRNEETGKLRGQMVLAWFNPDAPDVLAVTDMKRENLFCVEKSQQVPALDAPEEVLAKELQRADSHMRHARTLYSVIKSKHKQTFRPNLVDRDTVERGQAIESGRRAIEASRAERLNQQKQAAAEHKEGWNRLDKILEGE
jgi:hypothetical protein